jgi:hypothetical protein
MERVSPIQARSIFDIIGNQQHVLCRAEQSNVSLRGLLSNAMNDALSHSQMKDIVFECLFTVVAVGVDQGQQQTTSLCSTSTYVSCRTECSF